MSQPHVSVVIPSYTCAGTMRAEVQSVLVQTFADNEVIVVDDGSTVGTLGVLKAIDNPRLQFSHQTTNRSIGAASVHLIALQDSNESLEPRRTHPSKGERRIRAFTNFPLILSLRPQPQAMQQSDWQVRYVGPKNH